MAKVRLVVAVDKECLRLLGSLTTPHGKGEFIEGLIRQAAQRKAEPPEPPVDVVLKRIEQQVERAVQLLEQMVKGPG